ncbi:PCRF domain-containing protein [Candidatus Collierbacteria bacterium]|nr:PCRF domain-containing protein [Candidatus Collierbacteria bacterium]
MNDLQNEISRLEFEISRNRQLLNDPELSALAQEEIQRLEDQKRVLGQSINFQQSSNQQSTINPAEPRTVWYRAKRDTRQSRDNQQLLSRFATIEIRPGAGGDEAKIWVGDLARMYSRFCDIIGLKTVVIDNGIIKVAGAPNSEFRIQNSESQVGPYGLLKFESGVHRVQRIPQTESHGRIHTSTASVVVLPEITPLEVEIKDNELAWAFSHSGGPGGQNVNKVSTAVRLTHIPSGLVISVRQERTQQQNKSIALELLRSKLWEIEQEKTLKTLEQQRTTAVGRGSRAEKIRTYNFPQNRITDHRINKSWHNLDVVLEGGLEEIISEVQQLLD